jgi:CheY-like chemotaxis protein
MSADLISLRILTVFSAEDDRYVLRQGVSLVSIPIDVLEASNATAACGSLAGGDIDIVFLDAAFTATERGTVLAAAKAAKIRPFVFLLAASKDVADGLAGEAAVDGVAIKPSEPDAAKALMERCARVRLPKRVIVVDDSKTMRSIVRKILSASRFRLEVVEAEEGIQALKEIGSGQLDLAFLDYNMPGLNGVETLAEIKRGNPRIAVVIMTSTPDEALADRARAAGAAAFLKKPFFPADIDAVLHSIFGFK